MRWFEHDAPEPERTPEVRATLPPPPRRPTTALATGEEPPSRGRGPVAVVRAIGRWIRRVISSVWPSRALARYAAWRDARRQGGARHGARSVGGKRQHHRGRDRAA